MEAHGVRRVLVTDGENRVTGIVSLDDLLDACAKELTGLATVIRSGIEREVAESRARPRRSRCRNPSPTRRSFSMRSRAIAAAW